MITRASEVEYPTRDGKPMGETDAHQVEMLDYAIQVLKDHFASDERVYVSGNNFLYYVEGMAAAVVSPDCYVVRGVAKRLRPIFKVWEEGGVVPCFVLEVTSKSTRLEDLGDKMAKYRDDLKIPEYFLFDLTRDWIPEGLRGFRLVKDVYQPVEPTPEGRLPSRELGLELAVVSSHLRFFRDGAILPTRAERASRADATLRSVLVTILRRRLPESPLIERSERATAEQLAAAALVAAEELPAPELARRLDELLPR